MRDIAEEKEGIFQMNSPCFITDVIHRAIALSAKEDRVIKFEFNGVTVNVQANSKTKPILRDWQRARLGYIDKDVGPNPNPVLTDKEKASDARIRRRKRGKKK